MSITEVMLALGISSLVLACVGMLFLYSTRGLASISNYIDLDIFSRETLDRMTKEVRQVAALTSFATNEVTFLDLDGETVKYSWSPATRQFIRERPIGATPELLLKECDSLKFEMFQRTPQVGTNKFTPTTNILQCKMLSSTWRCSRTMFGKPANTESVQTTQIVLRNN